MGNCNFNSEKEKDNVAGNLILSYSSAITKNLFQFHFVGGKGGFGKVWKVEKKKTQKNYAMKEMAKARIIAKRSVNSVLNPKDRSHFSQSLLTLK